MIMKQSFADAVLTARMQCRTEHIPLHANTLRGTQSVARENTIRCTITAGLRARESDARTHLQKRIPRVESRRRAPAVWADMQQKQPRKTQVQRQQHKVRARAPAVASHVPEGENLHAQTSSEWKVISASKCGSFDVSRTMSSARFNLVDCV